ncbi:glycosyltransferase [Rhodobacteraceae bacterium]|nr:glycosyltransferase [Paracoccaceae bacterium]
MLNRKVLIGVICHNEASTLPQLFSELTNIKFDNELAVIHFDDGSTDDSHNICRKYNIVTIRNKYAKGYSNNVLNALEYFIKCKQYNNILIMDGDLEHNPRDIRRFLEKDNDYHLLIGSRNKKNRWAEKIIGLIMGWYFSVPDPYCGMRMFGFDFAKSFVYEKIHYADGLGPIFYAKRRDNDFCIGIVNIFVRSRTDEARFGNGLAANIKLFKNIFIRK